MDKELKEQIRDIEEHRDSLDGRHTEEISTIDRKVYELKLRSAGMQIDNRPLKGRSKHDAAIQLKAYSESIDTPLSLDEALSLVDVLTRGLRAGKHSSLVYQSPDELIILYNNLTLEELKNRCEQNLMIIAMKAAENNARAKGEYKPIKKSRTVSCKGAQYHFTNLKEFCEKHELSYSAMSKVLAGKQTHHKGYRLVS